MSPLELALRPALRSNDPVRNLALIAGEITDLRDELLRGEVRAARARGYSWRSIAQAMRGSWPSGQPAGLGELFPNGTSETTVRRWAE